MIPVVFRLYEQSKVRIARFEKRVSLHALPRPGDTYSFVLRKSGDDHRQVKCVEFHENSCILVWLEMERDEAGKPFVLDDEELNVAIIEMKASGWKLASLSKNSQRNLH